MAHKQTPKVPLPKDWNKHVRSAILHVFSLAQYAVAYTRSWAANSPNARVRLKAENGRLAQEVALLREELRIKSPNHVWRVDLTTVSIWGGFWTSWLPFALPQCWPFCWWVAVVLDRYSRRCMGVAVFGTAPTSKAVCAFLGRAIHRAGRAPKYIICDKGPQFWCAGFKGWCKHRKIKPRFGAIGQHGSIAVIERRTDLWPAWNALRASVNNACPSPRIVVQCAD
jgi:transposase InsO family protein